MEKLKVGLGSRSYPIVIGSGCLRLIPQALKETWRAGRYCLVSDNKVAKQYGEALRKMIVDAGLRCDLLVFEQGEENKNLTTIAALASRAARLGLDRTSMFIACGGGVTGDITGFLASIYMRGLSFIQVPTSLLAQVDSSVGGKTGVDIPEGKNLVGTFHQPKAVFIDTDVLKTLPETEYLSGMAEVIKHGIIRDRDFFHFLVRERQNILALREPQLTRVIYDCCRIKAEVVSADEREGNIRRILNFGHTIGHAVEAGSGFTLSHGFAVAIGMVAATRIAVNKGFVDETVLSEIYVFLTKCGLPTEIPAALDRKEMMSYLLADKKNIDGRHIFILPKAIGDVCISDEVTDRDIDRVFAESG
ncbi:MAG: 3-dehydroquinate synthase [Proteobacteria bacterium]|nr:MAG: 3-dehydroquinate synthase [Pseudomonadota bacterium]PIE65089.1 MAG: 3-dehydroquinate synthase [Desulfobacterales bacterium]